MKMNKGEFKKETVKWRWRDNKTKEKKYWYKTEVCGHDNDDQNEDDDDYGDDILTDDETGCGVAENCRDNINYTI
jgi:hypothetical protein